MTATPPPKTVLIAFSNPFGLLLVGVGRIAEYCFACPILDKAVVFFSVKLCAFCCFRSSTGIERKMKLRIKLVEELLRSRPIVLSG